MLSDFLPGDLVRSTRPVVDNLPPIESRRIGLIVCYVPPSVQDNSLAVTQLRVAWSGPNQHEFMTLEPDGRLAHV